MFLVSLSPPLSSKGAMTIASKLEEEPKRRFTVVKSVCPCGLRVGNERIILPPVVSDGPVPGSMVVN